MNITRADFGWVIVALLAAGAILSGVPGWLADRYEVTRAGRRVRMTRRWYGKHAHVCLRAAEDDDEAERFQVREWIAGETPFPWLLVQNIDDEDAEPFWAPVTSFAPYTVRRLRPHLARYGRILLPQLHVWLPLRQPVGYLQDGA